MKRKYSFILIAICCMSILVSCGSNNVAENQEEVQQDSMAKFKTLEEIQQKQTDVINEFKQIFEESGVPYETTPNGNVLLGKELSYTILEREYNIVEMVSVIFALEENEIQSSVNMKFEYHKEKGLEKDNPHVILLYNLLSGTNAYSSVEEMIEDMKNDNAKSFEIDGCRYKWEKNEYNSKNNIEFAYCAIEKCDYEYNIGYCELDSLEIRENKMDEYSLLVEQRLNANGLGDTLKVRTSIRNGKRDDNYASEHDNTLGAVVRFHYISTMPEDIENAVKTVQIYIDVANEVFGMQSPVSSLALAQDIVTRARLIRYSDESEVRLYNGVESYEDVLTPCIELLGEETNPVYNIQYFQSGYYIDKSGYYSKVKNSVQIEYYIPIKVEGVLNS